MIQPRLLALAALACLLPLQLVPTATAQEPVNRNKPVDANAARGTGAPAASQQAMLVGTVDLVRAFDQYPKWIRLRNELGDTKKRFEEQLSQATKVVEEIKARIGATAQGSEERKRAEFELEMALQQREWSAKMLREKLDLEESRALLAVYEDVESAIAVVAKARGVILVQRVHDLGPSPGEIGKLTAKDVQGRLMAFERKQVWFAATEIDLTNDLIKQLLVPVAETAPKADGKDGNRDGAAPTGNGDGQARRGGQ
jgi:Skp family chaperone for outer membrane proteins